MMSLIPSLSAKRDAKGHACLQVANLAEGVQREGQIKLANVFSPPLKCVVMKVFEGAAEVSPVKDQPPPLQAQLHRPVRGVIVNAHVGSQSERRFRVEMPSR